MSKHKQKHLFYYDTTHSKLRDAALADGTRRNYNNNLNKFLHYTRLTLHKLKQLDPIIVDQRLSEYIDNMFNMNDSYEYACQTLFGLIYRHPQLKSQLGESHLRLRGWKRLKK